MLSHVKKICVFVCVKKIGVKHRIHTQYGCYFAKKPVTLRVHSPAAKGYQTAGMSGELALMPLSGNYCDISWMLPSAYELPAVNVCTLL